MTEVLIGEKRRMQKFLAEGNSQSENIDTCYLNITPQKYEGRVISSSLSSSLHKRELSVSKF